MFSQLKYDLMLLILIFKLIEFNFVYYRCMFEVNKICGRIDY